MEVTLRFLNGEHQNITLQPTATIESIKNHISIQSTPTTTTTTNSSPVFPSHLTLLSFPLQHSDPLSLLYPKHSRLVHRGRVLAEGRLLSDYAVGSGDRLFVVPGVWGGGNDGGSIPTRSEMVRTKKQSKRADPTLLKKAKWLTCALSKQSLYQQRVVMDYYGNVFVKESLLKALIEKAMPSAFSHIRSLRNVFDVEFSLNAKYSPQQKVQAGQEAASMDSPFECRITGRPVNGQNTFSAIKPCGHIFSDKGLEKTESPSFVENTCFICGTSYTKQDIYPLNPEDDVLEALKLRLQTATSTSTTQSSLKKEKKAKKNATTSTSTNGHANVDESREDHNNGIGGRGGSSGESKCDKIEPLPEKKMKRKATDSTTDNSKPKKKSKTGPCLSSNGPTVRNVLSVQVALSLVAQCHDSKKKTSEAYKSIFSSQQEKTSSTAYFTGIPRGVIK